MRNARACWGLPLKAWASRARRRAEAEQPVGRAAHVQRHRQAVPARQRQLLAVEDVPAVTVQAGHEIVETDLAHGNQSRVLALGGQASVEQHQVLVGPPRPVHSGWMPSA